MTFEKMKWGMQANRLVKHPRQLLYVLHRLHEMTESDQRLFVSEYTAVLVHWLNAMVHWISGDNEWMNIGYVIQDFEDLLQLNEGVRIACDEDLDSYGYDWVSLRDLVQRKLDGRLDALLDTCESAYISFKPYFDMEHLKVDLRDLYPCDLTGPVFLDWIDSVSRYGFWSSSQSSKLQTSLVPFDSFSIDDAFTSKLSGFLWSMDMLKNFILFCEQVLDDRSIGLNDVLMRHLTSFDRLSEEIYMKMFQESQAVELGFPGINMKSLRFAKRLKTLFDRCFVPDVMIGVAELEDGRLMYGVSGPGGDARSILAKVDRYIGDDAEIAPIVADTTGYKRLVRVKEHSFKTHNGFECVEAKLFQGARDRENRMMAMSVLWHGSAPKRYCVEHSDLHFLARPCPGCVLNLRKYLIHT